MKSVTRVKKLIGLSVIENLSDVIENNRKEQCCRREYGTAQWLSGGHRARWVDGASTWESQKGAGYELALGRRSNTLSGCSPSA